MNKANKVVGRVPKTRPEKPFLQRLNLKFCEDQIFSVLKHLFKNNFSKFIIIPYRVEKNREFLTYNFNYSVIDSKKF